MVKIVYYVEINLENRIITFFCGSCITIQNKKIEDCSFLLEINDPDESKNQIGLLFCVKIHDFI